MAKEELLEFDGTVTEVLPDGNFRVKLDNDHEVLAYTAGKMRKFRIRTGTGDRVVVGDVALRPAARPYHLPPSRRPACSCRLRPIRGARPSSGTDL